MLYLLSVKHISRELCQKVQGHKWMVYRKEPLKDVRNSVLEVVRGRDSRCLLEPWQASESPDANC